MTRIGFLLLDGYALMSTSAAIEPLRAANLLAERELYRIGFLSPGGGPARSSSGGLFETEPLGGTAFDLVFVVAGGDPLAIEDARVAGWLRRLARAGVKLGGISGGSAILARAGLMAGRRFTLHWRHFDALRELSPDFLMERRLFVIDRDRYSCAGGVAPLDMMHALIAADQGAEFARRVSDWFIHTRIRGAEEPQRAGLAEAYGAHHPALLAAIGLMQSHIADPLDLGQLADLSGLGPRQLQRLFRDRLGRTFGAFYRDLRLDKADELLGQSALPVAEIAGATGFANAAHFARAFRAAKGLSPADRRRSLRPAR